MRGPLEFARGTWLPTLVFLTAGALIVGTTIGWNAIGDVVVWSVILTPAVWWWGVVPRTKAKALAGAIGGALAGVGIVLAPFVVECVLTIAARPRLLHARGDIADLAYIFVVLGALIAAAIGALLGAGVVLGERMREKSRDS